MIRHAPSIGLGLGLSLRSDTLAAPGLLDLYGGAAAAYSLRALSRGWLAGDVVEVRRSSDSTSQDFTASQITNGQMLSWVNTDPDPYSSDFSTAGRDGFDSGIRSTTTSNIDSIGGLDDNFRIVDSIDVSTSHYTQRTSFTVGFSYSVTMDIYLPSSNSILDGFTVGENTDSDSIYDGRTGFPTDTWISISGTITTTGNRLRISCAGGGSVSYTGNGTDAIYVRNITVTQLTADGFVSTWYDQSGNANDATQIATASQPKIVDAGALVTGGLDFDGVDDHLEADGFAFSPSGDFNAFTVANFSLNNYWDTRDGGGDGLFLQRGGSDFKSNYNGTSSNISAVTGDVLLSSELDGTDNNLYLNGGSKATTTVVAGLSTTANFLIGINFAGAEGIGTMRELILYDTSQSANRAAIDAEIIANYGL